MNLALQRSALLAFIITSASQTTCGSKATCDKCEYIAVSFTPPASTATISWSTPNSSDVNTFNCPGHLPYSCNDADANRVFDCNSVKVPIKKSGEYTVTVVTAAESGKSSVSIPGDQCGPSASANVSVSLQYNGTMPQISQ